MTLSTKGRYAVMAMVDLAQHSGGEPVSLAEIAERQEISLSYLEQLFAMLRKSGLVKSVRGPSSWRSTSRSGRRAAHPALPSAVAATAHAAPPTIFGKSSAIRSIFI
jgi:Rrf2 family transcriptional regulator, iron-sulfur cluster assembly transcription factor